MLFDAHAHLSDDFYTEEERREVVEKIEASELEYMVEAGTCLETSRVALENSEKYPWCYATAGFHPGELQDASDAALEEIAGLAASEKVVAIGEIGLDYHYDDADPEAQKLWFRKQLRLANRLKMPIVIHTRDADKDTMDILIEEGAFSEERKSWFPVRPVPSGLSPEEQSVLEKDARVLLHCFSGSSETAEQYLKLGVTISICGPVTFKNNRKTVEVVQKVPIEFLTSETDSPFLTPEPHRGKKNMPVNVEHVVRRIAVIKGISYEDACRHTVENARRFYGI